MRRISDLVKAKKPEGKLAGADPSNYSELSRILALPLRGTLSKQEVEEFSRQEIRPHWFAQGFRWMENQARAILHYDEVGGLLAPCAVGSGKTGITVAIAARAYRKGVRRVLLFVPPQVYPQLVKRDLPFWKARVDLAVPWHFLGNRKKSERARVYGRGMDGVYVAPYSLLSAQDASEMLEAVAPGLVILDEAHLVKNPTAARTRRLRAYLNARHPEVVALSGTITSKSVKDYHHLVKAALGPRSPLPTSTVLAYDWGNIIDAGAFFQYSATGPIRPLVKWAREQWPEEQFPYSQAGFRKAFQHRLTSAPGVVATFGERDIGSSLLLVNQPVAHYERALGWPELEEHFRVLEEEWKTPNGDEIEHAIHTFKWNLELSAGFYNQLRWPEPGERGATAEAIARAKEHHDAQQEYARVLRRWLQDDYVPGLDTPFLVGREMSQHGAARVGSRLYVPWKEAKDLEFEGMPQRIPEAVRVCPYKVQHAVEWARKLPRGTGGIVWFHHQEIGRWATELLEAAGFEAVYCPAGRAANERILDTKPNQIVVASIEAHGTGKNLQHFHQQLVLQWPRPAKTAEQLLGRLHRTGQEADEVVTATCATIEFDQVLFFACVVDALYQHQTTGVRQKLVYATYEPLPKVFPLEALTQRGIEGVPRLTPEQKSLLEEQFGSLDR